MHPEGPVEPAKISKCVMVMDECHQQYIEALSKSLFSEVETKWDGAGSPFQRWYRKVATGPDAVRESREEGTDRGLQGRLIAWKTKKPFQASSLFFRSLDTSKLLPMHLADFRVQMYAHPSKWDELDNHKNVTRSQWKAFAISSVMHELLLMRNMHDRGGGDIPFIVTNWDAEHTERAFNYWVALSKGDWTGEERNAKFDECHRLFCRNARPCFLQADLLVRSLLSDPEVGYLPPFIMFYPATKDGRACALFTKPSHCPPPSLTSTWPKCCNSPSCEETECGFFSFDACRSLAPNSPMVGESVWPPPRVLCNVWQCDARHSPLHGQVLRRCQRCKETIYCTVEHQTLDWKMHKNVCEKI